MSTTSSPATPTPPSPPPRTPDPTPTTPPATEKASTPPPTTAPADPGPVGLMGKVQATVASLKTAPSRSWGLPGSAPAGPSGPGWPNGEPGNGSGLTVTSATEDVWPFDDDQAAAPKRTPRQRVDVRAVSACLSQILQIVANAAGWVASRRGFDLRPPTEEERAKVADPAAALAARKLGVAFLTQDLVDVVQIGAGIAGYVETKPLARVYAGEPTEQPNDPTEF